MKVIPPISITSSMFTSTVSEPSAGETAWVSGSGYAVGARVIRTSTHRVYECIATVTAATAASTTTPEASVTSITPYWADAGPTNKYAMFDLYRNSATTPGTTAMTVVCTPGQRIDSVALMGMSNVQQVRISATSVNGKNANLLNTSSLNSSGVTLSDTTATKSAGTSGWDSGYTSTYGYSGRMSLTFKVGISAYFIVGLKSNTASGYGSGSIDWGIYFQGGGMSIIANGNNPVGTTYTTGDTFTIAYDGTYIKYYKNGVEFYSVTASPTGTLYAGATFYHNGAYTYDMYFSSFLTSDAVYDTGYISLNKRNTLGWYNYFFSRIKYADIYVKFDIPPYTDIVVTIEFIGATTMYIGGTILGMSEWIGYIQRKPSLDTLNFSKVDRDAFGNATMTPRRNVPKTNQTLFLENTYLARVLEVKENLNAVPALWCGIDDIGDSPYFEQLMIVGFYRTFSVDIDNPLGVFITLELEEL